MKSNKPMLDTVDVQHLTDGTWLVRAAQPSGRILTAVAEEDDVLRILAAKLAAKKKAELLELDKKLGLDKIFGSCF